MYIKVHQKDDQWFRDDGTLVGKTINSYFYTYYGSKNPIIRTVDGLYIRPILGRIDPKTKKFVPLCEGISTKMCTGPFCHAYSENRLICPRHMVDDTDGYYIVFD